MTFVAQHVHSRLFQQELRRLCYRPFVTVVTKRSLRYDRGDGQQHRRVLKRLPLAGEGFHKAHSSMRISCQSSHQRSSFQHAIASDSEYSWAHNTDRMKNLAEEQSWILVTINKETVGFHVVELNALATEALSLIGVLINRLLWECLNSNFLVGYLLTPQVIIPFLQFSLVMAPQTKSHCTVICNWA